MATNNAIPEIAQRAGAPITNVGSGTGTLPNTALTPRTSTSTGDAILPTIVGGAAGALLSNPSVLNAIKNAVTGGGGGGGGGASAPQQSSMASGILGSVQKFLMPAGATQDDFNAKYGTTNGQPNVVVSGVDMTTGQVIGTANTAIPSSVTTMTPSQGGLSLGAAAPAQTTQQSQGNFFQDDVGNIYTATGDLYAVKAGNSYYVNTGTDTWVNSNTGLSFSTNDLFGGSTDTIDYIDPDEYFASSDYSTEYDPYADYTPSDFTSYYTPVDYSGDLSPWGQGSSDDTSYYTPIDTSIGPQFRQGGLATPMYAGGGKVQADGVHMADGGVIQTIMNYLGSGGVQGALAGALLSQLLNSTSSGGVNQGVDMSKVGVIQPRTTSFGMGAPNYIPYSAYREPASVTPPNQLFSDLGVSGFAPVVSPLTAFGKNPLAKADGGSISPYYTYGNIVRPEDNLAMGGQPLNTNVPILAGRKDYRHGSYVEGAGDGQSDDIPAMLADGEYVIDSEVVSALGNGSNKAGAKVLDKMRENIRKHKRSGSLDSIPPKAKSPLAYMKGAK